MPHRSNRGQTRVDSHRECYQSPPALRGCLAPGATRFVMLAIPQIPPGTDPCRVESRMLSIATSAARVPGTWRDTVCDASNSAQVQTGTDPCRFASRMLSIASGAARVPGTWRDRVCDASNAAPVQTGTDPCRFASRMLSIASGAAWVPGT
jgi:hypothetical protein